MTILRKQLLGSCVDFRNSTGPLPNSLETKVYRYINTKTECLHSGSINTSIGSHFLPLVEPETLQNSLVASDRL